MTIPSTTGAGNAPAPPRRKTIHCQAQGCTRIATAFTYDTASRTVSWASCNEHKRWHRPMTERHGRDLSVAAGVVFDTLAWGLARRLTLANKKLPELVQREIAWDLLDALGRDGVEDMLMAYAQECVNDRA